MKCKNGKKMEGAFFHGRSIRFIQQDFHKRKETWSVGEMAGISLNRASRISKKILSMAANFPPLPRSFSFFSKSRVQQPHMSRNYSTCIRRGKEKSKVVLMSR